MKFKKCILPDDFFFFIYKEGFNYRYYYLNMQYVFVLRDSSNEEVGNQINITNDQFISFFFSVFYLEYE